MTKLINKINAFLYTDFIFSPQYRVWRHIIYWSFHVTTWGLFWMIMGHQSNLLLSIFKMCLWMPVFIFFGYPLAYIAVPKLLLKGRLWQFLLVIIAWGGIGIFINTGFKMYIYAPVHDLLRFPYNPNSLGFSPHSYLCMTTSAISPVMIRFFKLWSNKQQDWMQAQKEKVTAELQLLKAQLHPHFLFNTLNNIYSFALENSSKTPQLILKLSSLLNYMLYECRSEEVLLEKELEVLNNYIDLERERYGKNIEISVTVDGEIENKYIAPLLILPFLENAFKHGASEQLDKPWLHVSIAVSGNMLKCIIVNSKNEVVPVRDGVGIDNLKSRLQLLYPGHHMLKLSDEGDYFEASLVVQLPSASAPVKSIFVNQQQKIAEHENAMFAHRR